MSSWRWKRWAAGIAGLLAVYTAAGFWLLPWVIKAQLPAWGQSALARPLSVEEVRFNPYTLRLQLQALRLAEADGTPLLGVESGVVDLQWASLLQGTWRFAEIRLTAPSAHLSIAADGQFNLAELAATLARRPGAANRDTGLPRLHIGRFVLEQGQLAWRDRRHGHDHDVGAIELTLLNFSTLPQQGDRYTFSATTAHGGKIGIQGELSVNPIRGSGELTLTDLALAPLAAYLQPSTGLTLAGGQLGAVLPFRFAYGDGQFTASLDGARLALRELVLADARAQPPLHLRVGAAGLQGRLSVEQGGAGLQLRVAEAALRLGELSLSSGTQTPVTLAQLGFEQGSFDLAARRLSLGRLHAEGGQLQLRRDRQGQLNLVQLLRGVASGGPARADPAADATWHAAVARVDVSRFGAAVEDQGSGIRVQVQDFAATLEGASSDLSQPIRFEAALRLREGGELSAQGSAVPASSTLLADVRLQQVALKPLQPLLDPYVKLKIVGGRVSAQGRLSVGAGKPQGVGLRYVGGLQVDGFALNDAQDELFASWKLARADQLSASLNPHRLEIAELRFVEPVAELIINPDRTLNTSRLHLRQAASGVPSPPAPTVQAKATAPAVESAFPVRIRRLQLENGLLDFADLSLLPQFRAKIYALNGVATGLSSRRDARSQVELDGRVDEFGLARIRGQLNPFVLSDNTQLNVVFQNVDLVQASPYSAKFAGYKIAEGKISLDLEYRVRDGQLEGHNRIIIDRLTLGERVDSPDALKLPLELAIALLKDSAGRIDLGLPVSGSLNDPTFSYAAVLWKAFGELISSIVTAPFRALGRLLGVKTEALEAIHFDPGSERLLPPQREKVQQIAQLLAQRTQLRLSVPGQYSEAADGAALRERALRLDIARRAGFQVEAGESVGSLDLGQRSVREAVRALYAERFGAEALDQQKKAAERAVPAQTALPLWTQAGKLLQGEPRVTEASGFYRALQERLIQQQPLAADALAQLGAQRARVILAALREAGVDADSAVATAAVSVRSEIGRPVPLTLSLTSK